MKDVIEFLSACVVDGNVIKVPKEQVDKKIYAEAKKRLEEIGGEWKSKLWGFTYKADPTLHLTILQAGERINMQQKFQTFYTPAALAREDVEILSPRHNHRILEPSAGQGALIDAVVEYAQHLSTTMPHIHYVELNEINRQILHEKYGHKGYIHNLEADTYLRGNDFITLDSNIQKFDRIIANPPFTNNQDIHHIYKMWFMLAPGGRIVTHASVSWLTGKQKMQTQFAAWLIDQKANVEKIAAGAFKESGTNVETVRITLDKPNK
jgi:hypothetical protein